MKKMKLFSPGFFLLAAVVLTSCGTSVEIAQRKFNSGYYVHVTKKAVKSAATADAAEAPPAPESSVSPAPVKDAQFLSDVSSAVKTGEENNGLSASVASQPEISRKQHVRSLVATPAAHSEVEKVVPLQADKTKVRFLQKRMEKYSHRKGGDVPAVILILLCLFLPFIAVGIVDDWGTKFLIDILLCLLFWIPGVIYAFIVCFG